MATKKSKKSNGKRLADTIRNEHAVVAHFHTGGGKHGDRRLRRRRDRGSQRRAALADAC